METTELNRFRGLLGELRALGWLPPGHSRGRATRTVTWSQRRSSRRARCSRASARCSLQACVNRCTAWWAIAGK